MCAECEADDAEPLREVYLARRARIAQTWTPRRHWAADAVALVAMPVPPPPAAEPMPVAAE